MLPASAQLGRVSLIAKLSFSWARIIAKLSPSSSSSWNELAMLSLFPSSDLTRPEKYQNSYLQQKCVKLHLHHLYFFQMEYNLNFFQMEDNLYFFQMEDDFKKMTSI